MNPSLPASPRRLGTLDYFLGFLLYFSMISGGVIPLVEFGLAKAVVKLTVMSCSLFVICHWRKLLRRTHIHLLFCLIGLCILLTSMISTQDIPYALSKIDGAIFSPIISTMLFSILMTRKGIQQTIRIALHVGIFVLASTLVYKYRYGFFDRAVIYFLNGPIVFGWLMGFFSLLSMFFAILRKRRVYFLLVFVFLLAVVWSGSKGALVSTSISMLFSMTIQQNITKKIFFISLTAITAFMMLPIIFSYIAHYFPAARTLAIQHVIEGSTRASDEGSIGSRKDLLNDAFRAFQAKPILGIGLGNFSYYTNGGFVYPHNAHLEIFVECGTIGGVFYMLFVFFALARAPAIFRTIALYFIVASSFSGDIAYLRFLFMFLILGLIFSRTHSPVKNRLFNYGVDERRVGLV